jgi:hypothetical protein
MLFSYNGPNSKVKYNNTFLTVQEIRLYKPSLNTYNGKKADAELFIHHISSSGMNLIVCIPIVTSSAKSASHNLFQSIIRFTPIKANTSNVVNVSDYNLNHLVPRASFYSYTGSLPYKPCVGNYNVILFDLKDAINMNKSDMDMLGKRIKTEIGSVTKPLDTSKYMINENGTKIRDETAGDDIYIDCRPVNEMNVELTPEERLFKVQQKQTELSTQQNIMNKIPMEVVWSILGISGGVILLYGSYKVFQNLIDNATTD